MPKIPFNRPHAQGKEIEYIQRALHQNHISGDGPFTKKCQQVLEKLTGSWKALLTTSCTHALEMAALLLDIQEGDEVIVPSFTFVSTVNAFVLRGARPVFVDICPRTLNLDPNLLRSRISQKTRAICAVHYAGVGCEMDAIMEVANSHRVPVVEDNAHGLFGRYKEKPLGTFGRMATLSFHETKNLTCGEGGALLINDEGLIERAEILREKGTNRSKFFRGQVDKYSWVDIGSSYLPSDILSAYLLAQLEASSEIQARRKRIWERYYEKLEDWAREHNVGLPFVPPHCDQAYHMFYLILPSLAKRQGLIEHLKIHNIMGVFHYLPLHLSPMGAKFGGKQGDCPVTERISDTLLRLPFYFDLDFEAQDLVVAAIKSFCIDEA